MIETCRLKLIKYLLLIPGQLVLRLLSTDDAGEDLAASKTAPATVDQATFGIGRAAGRQSL